MEILKLNDLIAEGQLFLDHGFDPHVKAYLPAKWRDNHASNLIELENGDLRCVWFAGLAEGASDVKVAMSRLNKGTDRWTQPVLLSDDYSRSEQNPSLFQDQDGKLWLLHPAQMSRGLMTTEEWDALVKAGEGKGGFYLQETAEIRLRTSDDNGYTWSEMKPYFTKPDSFCRHPIRVLSNGDWIFPIWYSVAPPPEGGYATDYSAVHISTDQGKTWQEYPVPGSEHRVHMCAVETRPGHLVAFFRSRAADRIYRAFSDDYGRTWTKPTATELPNNNASIQAIRLKSGCIALVYNDCKGQDIPDQVLWGAPRIPIMVAITEDEGESFPYRRCIEPGDGFFGAEKDKLNRTYHYPCIMQSRDGAIHISYTHFGRACIMYHRIDEDWIRGKK